MMHINVHTCAGDVPLELDTSSDFEVLHYQILSLLECGEAASDECPLMLDSLGREISSIQDILDISSTSNSTEGLSAAAELWYYSGEVRQSGCTSSAFGDEPLLQPCYRFVDSNFYLCFRCSTFLDPSLLVGEGDTLRAFTCDCSKLVEFGLVDESAAQLLKVEAGKRKELIGCLSDSIGLPLYCRRKLLDDAVSLQSQFKSRLKGREDFQRRVDSTSRSVMVYEDPEQQRVAREVVDYAKVHCYVEEQRADPATAERGDEELFMHALLRWFKCDHFKWCNKARCTSASCSDKQPSMEGRGVVEPSPWEREVGWAGRTELYQCNHCQGMTRFPRHNNPSYLLKHSPQGRCGEFANAFCLLCRSLGLDARYVLDFTDHVWVEVWLESRRRFAHCDPCERALDTPLMYEAGWNKSLSHVLSFSRYGVEDASARYSRKQRDVIVRRSGEVVAEALAGEVLQRKDAELERAYVSFKDGAAAPAPITASWCERVRQGASAFTGLRDVAVETMQERKRLLRRELQALRFETSKSWKIEELQGRISGDTEWKLARGELGTGKAGGDEGAEKAAGDREPAVAAKSEVQSVPAWWRPGMVCDTAALRGGVAVRTRTTPAIFLPIAKVILPLVPVPDHPSNEDCKGPSASVLSSDPAVPGGPSLLSSTAFLSGMSLSAVALSSPVVGYTCSTPSGCISSAAGESRVDFIARLTTLTLAADPVLGFAVKTEASGSTFVALLFGEMGFPLRPADGCETFVKQRPEEVVLPPPQPSCGPTFDLSPDNGGSLSSSAALSWRKSYFYLGGGQHGDTRYFDSTAFLEGLLPHTREGVEAFTRSLRLVRVVVWAGDSLVNGVQCFFDSSLGPLSSPPCSSSGDNPQPHELVLSAEDRVTSVSIRSGALVDSLTIDTALGKALTAGGAGGHNTARIDIPEGMALCGFVGGCGGHLHNVGVALVEQPAGGAAETDSRPLHVELVKLCESCHLAECELLLAHPVSNGGIGRAQTGKLVELTAAVLVSPDAEGCFKTIVTYLENIAKDLQNQKMQSIKLTNAFLTRSVLAVPRGLELLCFGPGCFSVSTDMATVDSGLAASIAALPGHQRAERITQLRDWIGRYVRFLRAASALHRK